MWEWMHANPQLFAGLMTVVMTVAWIAYAQFGIVTYLWQRQPRIIIDQTADRRLTTRFVVANLSEQPVYIAGILMVVRRRGEETVHRINTFRQPADGEDPEQQLQEIDAQLQHGALEVGQVFMLGSSAENLGWLLDEVDPGGQKPDDDRLRDLLREIDHFEIRVIAMVGVNDRPIASARRFDVHEVENDLWIFPQESHTLHYSTWRNRHVAEQWSKQYLTK